MSSLPTFKILWGFGGGLGCWGFGVGGGIFLVGISVEYSSFSYLKGPTLSDFKHSRDKTDCKIVSSLHSLLTSFSKNGNPLTLQHHFSGG